MGWDILYGAPAPYDDEHPESWISRMAVTTGIQRTKILHSLGARENEKSAINLITEIPIARLVAQTRIPESVLQPIINSAHYLKTVGDPEPHFPERKQILFCPLCLREAPQTFFKTSWTPNHSLTCTTHLHVLLVKRCSRCRNILYYPGQEKGLRNFFKGKSGCACEYCNLPLHENKPVYQTTDSSVPQPLHSSKSQLLAFFRSCESSRHTLWADQSNLGFALWDRLEWFPATNFSRSEHPTRKALKHLEVDLSSLGNIQIYQPSPSSTEQKSTKNPRNLPILVLPLPPRHFFATRPHQKLPERYTHDFGEIKITTCLKLEKSRYKPDQLCREIWVQIINHCLSTRKVQISITADELMRKPLERGNNVSQWKKRRDGYWALLKEMAFLRWEINERGSTETIKIFEEVSFNEKNRQLDAHLSDSVFGRLVQLKISFDRLRFHAIRRDSLATDIYLLICQARNSEPDQFILSWEYIDQYLGNQFRRKDPPTRAYFLMICLLNSLDDGFECLPVRQGIYVRFLPLSLPTARKR